MFNSFDRSTRSYRSIHERHAARRQGDLSSITVPQLELETGVEARASDWQASRDAKDPSSPRAPNIRSNQNPKEKGYPRKALRLSHHCKSSPVCRLRRTAILTTSSRFVTLSLSSVSPNLSRRCVSQNTVTLPTSTAPLPWPSTASLAARRCRARRLWLAPLPSTLSIALARSRIAERALEGRMVFLSKLERG